jgi:hypothetical protein
LDCAVVTAGIIAALAATNETIRANLFIINLKRM